MIRKPNPIIDSIQEEIERTLESFGFELVQLKLGGRSGSRTLTVYIDSPDGVTAHDCQYMASRLSVLLDVLDPIPERYTLVVSSPGVNRPLTKENDFERFKGNRVVLRWAQPGSRPHTRRGILAGLAGQDVKLDVDGTEVLVPLAEIESANIVYDWDKPAHERDEGA